MHRLHTQVGVAAVELALLLIPLLVLTFGTIEYGRAVYEYNILVKATRDATRYLSGQGPGDPTDWTKAKCLAAYGNISCSGSTLLPSLTTSMVYVCDSSNYADCSFSHANVPTGSGAINLVTVKISGYQFNPLLPISLSNANLNFSTTSFTFNDISTTMRQVL